MASDFLNNESYDVTTVDGLTLPSRNPYGMLFKRILNKEGIKYALSAIEDYDNLEIPELPLAMQSLVYRVENIDKIQQRINRMPDKKYFGKLVVHKKVGVGKRLLNMILHK